MNIVFQNPFSNSNSLSLLTTNFIILISMTKPSYFYKYFDF
ncbi:Uncharacterised protein [Empedobacter falsenii]|uniref:Uncharacterized protein n=1 Tax=Empedobacter falsenii TaxID=343874 RepID=A0A376G6B7_9FLAO|nr:Uncharacterised protein [Empedobacter falsenii]